MKIGIISDTHGNKKAIDTALGLLPDMDMWLHAGDYTRDGEYLKKHSPVPVKMVAGNNDVYFDNKYPEEELFEIDGVIVWLTHGHRHQVKWNVRTLARAAKQLGAAVAVFGHTHEALIEQLEGVLLINPGAASIWDSANVAVLEIADKKIGAKFVEL